ncbi:MAG TPA: DUF72 domain-containing protein [Candidatus Limnocylindrales bacterium]|nr:DUF72 domain-containing protein [Candidatus Limnocylindrales bacterium]
MAERDFLAFYASRLPACELNGTFYARPSPRAIDRWTANTPPTFRFIVKAQRGGAFRAMGPTPDESIAWLTAPLPAFGDRLGAVLFRVPREIRRRGPEDDERLVRVLDAWPRAIPLVVELQDRSWHVDETFRALEASAATLCATELDEDAEPPTLRLTGPTLYLRLRRIEYSAAEIEAWAARLVPFLAAGTDAWAFFRHDETGLGPERALALAAAVERALATDGRDRTAEPAGA